VEHLIWEEEGPGELCRGNSIGRGHSEKVEQRESTNLGKAMRPKGFSTRLMPGFQGLHKGFARDIPRNKSREGILGLEFKGLVWSGAGQAYLIKNN